MDINKSLKKYKKIHLFQELKDMNWESDSILDKILDERKIFSQNKFHMREIEHYQHDV